MKPLTMFTCFALILSIFSAALPVNGEVEIYDSVLRLHVLANSDSAEDQELKLCVRDAVLECMSEGLSDCENIEQAKTYVSENIGLITSSAEQCIKENGYDYTVAIETGIEKYPTRNYGKLSLPSGDYYSVKVKIGRSEGQNWWCVLFPPLCIGASMANEPEEELAAVGLTQDEINIITKSEEPEYEIKFKLLEIFKKAFV